MLLANHNLSMQFDILLKEGAEAFFQRKRQHAASNISQTCDILLGMV